MLLKAPGHDLYIRVIALVTLFIGLSDAARLLGLSLGDTSPIVVLGTSGFIHLAVFTLNRLLAAVGLWLKETWGIVMLVGTTVVELLVYGLGTAQIQIGLFSFIMRVVVLIAILVVFGLAIRFQRIQAD